MKAGLFLLALLLLPAVLAQAPAQVENVRVEAGNQILRVTWDPVAGAPGYTVVVYQDGSELQRADATTNQFVTRNVINDRPYAVAVAARASDGSLGPWSAPAAGVPTSRYDQTYLALGLGLTWVGLWLYAALLTRAERDLHNKIDSLTGDRR